MAGFLSPAVALGAVLATAYGTVFHLWSKGDLPALWRYLFAGWFGFTVGHLLGGFFGLPLIRIGQLNVFAGSVAALAVLLIAKRLEA